MKKLNSFLTMTLFLIAMSILISCSSSKTAINCPTLPRSNSKPKASSNLKKLDKKVFAYSQRKPTKTRNTNNLYATGRRNKALPTQSVSNLEIITNKAEDPYFEMLRVPAKVDYNKSLLASIDNSAVPFELMLPISRSTINSTTNTNLTATIIKGRREDASTHVNNSINMSSENIKSHTNPNLINSVPQDIPTKNEGLGLAGFVLSLVGFLLALIPEVGLIPLGLIPIIFGIISLVRIKRNPAKYKGKGLAIGSLVLGIIDIILGFIVTVANIGD